MVLVGVRRKQFGNKHTIWYKLDARDSTFRIIFYKKVQKTIDPQRDQTPSYWRALELAREDKQKIYKDEFSKALQKLSAEFGPKMARRYMQLSNEARINADNN